MGACSKTGLKGGRRANAKWRCDCDAMRCDAIQGDSVWGIKDLFSQKLAPTTGENTCE